jgi:hypothetical protein
MREAHVLAADESPFACRIAAFNALGFCVTVAGVTFLDARLTHLVQYAGPRVYPYGYYPCLVALVVFAAVFFLIGSIRRKGMVWLFAPAFSVLVVTAAVQPFFNPSAPHMAMIGWMFLYAVATFLSQWIHSRVTDPQFLTDNGMDKNAKLDWIKESVVLWRTLLTGFILSYVGLVITWLSIDEKMSEIMTNDKADLELLRRGNATALAMYSLFVIAGPINELYRKTQQAMNLFGCIKNERLAEPVK